MTDNVFVFAQARATSRAELVNSWLTGGALTLYSGARPATADTAISSQTALATFAFPDPAGAVANGVFTAGTIAAAMVMADGTATWARALDSLGATVADADVGVPASGAMIELSAINLLSGAYVSVLSFTLTEG